MRSRLLVGLSIAVYLGSGASAQTSVSLTFVDRPSAAPLALITVSGNGFDPANAAISLIFSARDAVAVSVPVTTAGSTSVQVAVPPLVNSSTGDLFDSAIVADIQAVQVTRSSITTSNVLGGLTIEPAPAASGAAGSLTNAFLRTMLDVQADLRVAAAASPALEPVAAASSAFVPPQRALIDAVGEVMRTRDRAVALPTTDGRPLLVDAQTLRIADRLILAFVRQTVRAYTSSPPPQAIAAAIPGGCQCASYGSDADALLCEFRRHPCTAYDAARKVTPAAAAAAYSAQLGLLAAWAAGGLASNGIAGEQAATALGVLWGEAIAYLAAVNTGTDPPGIASVLTDTGSTILNEAVADGLPVFSGLSAGVSLGQEIERAVTASQGESLAAPQAGVVLPSPPGSTPPGSRRLLSYMTTAATTAVQRLSASETQRTAPLATAVLPPPTVGRFNGAYGGGLAGSCTSTTSMGTATVAITELLSLAIGNGEISVMSGSGSGTGTVTASGQVDSGAATVEGATCQWGGRFWDDGRLAGGRGAIACSAPDTTCAFNWSALRTQ